MLARVSAGQTAATLRRTPEPEHRRVTVALLAAVSMLVVLLLAFAAAGLLDDSRFDDAPVAPRPVASQFAA